MTRHTFCLFPKHLSFSNKYDFNRTVNVIEVIKKKRPSEEKFVEDNNRQKQFFKKLKQIGELAGLAI